MKNQIFCYGNFFGSSPFLIHHISKKGQKRAAALKARIQRNKNAKEASRRKPFLQGGTGTSNKQGTMAPVQPKDEMFD